MMLVSSFGVAQELAALEGMKKETNNVKQNHLKSLKIAYDEIEEQYNISIAYKTELIENKNVEAEIKYNGTLEKDLTALIQQHGLKFLKVKPNFYVIKKETLPESNKKDVKIRSEEQLVEDAVITVKGKVTSNNGETIPGVNVLIKETSTGTVTDIEGKYSLSSPEDGILVFSSIGFITQEVMVNSRVVIDIVLEEDMKNLDEVVVVGYSTQQKASITGSVTSIDSKEIESISEANLVTGLVGRLPGLRVTQRTGEPGTYSTAFDIRGYGNPLIVVDGIVRNDFNKFDPNSIESITVLKDASAAVYGVQAANGVILVTTKKGKLNSSVITYSGNYDFQKFTVVPELTDAYEFAVLTAENEIAGGQAAGSTTYSPEDIQKYKEGTYPSTDWLGAITRNNSNLVHHNLSISGGNEKVKYFTSMGYMAEAGIWKSGDLNYKRYNLQSSVTVDVTDNLKAQLNIDGTLEDHNNTSLEANNIFFTAMLAQPTLPLYANNNTEYLQIINPENVLADTYAERSGYAKTKTKSFQGNFSLDYNFKNIDGLTARFMSGFYNRDLFEKDWRKRYYVYNYDAASDTYNIAGSGKWTPTSMYENYIPLQRTTILGQLTYEKIFSQKHHIKSIIVYEGRNEKNDNLYVNKEFAIDVDQLYAGLAQNTQASSSNIYEKANQSVIGTLDYGFLSKYLFSVGFNYGGSSMFPKGKRWGFFPFASIGWRISDEQFILDNFSFITDLKLRGSWGKMGDDGAANFQYLTGYDYPSGNYIFDGQVIPALGFRGLPNPNITWFTATTKNIGLDLDISDIITLQFDLFRRDRSGLLASRNLSLPATVGANLPQENLNKDMQQGFEFVIGHTGSLGNLTYGISTNMTYTQGRDINIERSSDGNSFQNWRNNTADRWKNIQWGYKYIGQFQTEQEILSSVIQDGQGNRTLRPGDLKYEDVNRDGIISDLDLIPIAKGNVPSMQFALGVNLGWRNFDLEIFAQGATGYSYRYNGMNSEPLRWSRNSLSQFMDRWHHEDIFNTDSPWVPGYYPPTGYVPSNRWTSSFWLSNGSYLRLKNVDIGYTINQSFLEEVGIENLRISLRGTNLYTLTNLRNIDPEQQQDFFYSYPLNKSLGMGLSVTF